MKTIIIRRGMNEAARQITFHMDRGWLAGALNAIRRGIKDGQIVKGSVLDVPDPHHPRQITHSVVVTMIGEKDSKDERWIFLRSTNKKDASSFAFTL